MRLPRHLHSGFIVLKSFLSGEEVFRLFFRNNSLLLLAVLSAISLIFMKMEEADVIRRISTTGTGFRSAIADKIASYGYLINLKSENDRLLETNLSLVAKNTLS